MATKMRLSEKREKSGAEKAILNFHTVRQYKDAARLKVFRQTGSFPKVTRGLGIESLIEVLKEDSKFPTTKSDLIKDQGWKIFDWKNNQRRRVSDEIEKLPDKTYRSLNDLTQAIKKLSSK